MQERADHVERTTPASSTAPTARPTQSGAPIERSTISGSNISSEAAEQHRAEDEGEGAEGDEQADFGRR